MHYRPSLKWVNGNKKTRLLMYCGYTFAKIVKSGRFSEVCYFGNEDKVKFLTSEHPDLEDRVRSTALILMAETVAYSLGSSKCEDRRS